MKLITISVVIFLGLLAACSVLTLQPVNFAWPIESVLEVDDDGNVSEDRYALEFNTVGLFFEESQDCLGYIGREIRIIRDNLGYYFITSINFKNVYVFRSHDGTMVLDNKILVLESGIENPAFNQRSPIIELVDGENVYNLTHKGIEGSE